MKANSEKCLLKFFHDAGVRLSPKSEIDGVLSGKFDAVIGEIRVFPWPLSRDISVLALLPEDKKNAVSGNGEGLANRILISPRHRADLKALCAPFDLRRRYGKAWLVGFGPGDPGLVTVKAQSLLKKADVILYDALVGDFALSAYSGRLIKVGRRHGSHIDAQEHINRRIYRMIVRGLNVVRLKGGDPMIYGRGGEEVDFLSRRFIPVEVVPGISAFQAASAAAGVPLTMRGLSASLEIRTAHGWRDGRFPPAKPKTTVFYMGAARTSQISKRLIREDHCPLMPAIVIEDIGLATERCAATTVAGLSKMSAAAPSLILAGPVAGLYWHQEKVLYTGRNPIDHAGPERAIGFPLSNGEAPKIIPRIDSFDAVAFETVAAVDLFSAVFHPFPKHLLVYASNRKIAARAILKGACRNRIIIQGKGKQGVNQVGKVSRTGFLFFR